MRYSPQHKAEARQRLVESSAAAIKANGYSASGVDKLAAAAGVTTGSLYKHFEGKEALLAATLREDLSRTQRRFSNIEPGNVAALERAIDAYLDARHVNNPADGCPLPALAAEVARAEGESRDAFDEGLLSVHAAVEAAGCAPDLAWALISQCVGAVMLARACQGATMRRGVLSGARAAAKRLLCERAAPDF